MVLIRDGRAPHPVWRGEGVLGAPASRRRMDRFIVMLRAGEMPALPGGCGPGERFAESFAEQGDDLPDLDDLFGRRQNKRRETFPRVLPQHAQTVTGGNCVAHRRVIGKSFEHGGQIRFGLQIIAQPPPIGDPPGGFGANAVAHLRQAHPTLADDAGPGIIAGMPAEGLAGVQRRGQIVIANAQKNRGPAFAPTLRRGRRGRGRDGGIHSFLPAISAGCGTPRDARGGKRVCRF